MTDKRLPLYRTSSPISTSGQSLPSLPAPARPDVRYTPIRVICAAEIVARVSVGRFTTAPHIVLRSQSTCLPHRRRQTGPILGSAQSGRCALPSSSAAVVRSLLPQRFRLQGITDAGFERSREISTARRSSLRTVRRRWFLSECLCAAATPGRQLTKWSTSAVSSCCRHFGVVSDHSQVTIVAGRRNVPLCPKHLQQNACSRRAGFWSHRIDRGADRSPCMSQDQLYHQRVRSVRPTRNPTFLLRVAGMSP